MSLRTLIVIGLSLVCGLSAAVGVTKLRGDVAVETEPETTQVVIAAVNLDRGNTLTEQQLTTRAWPEALVPPGTMTNIEDVIGRTVLTPIVKDEPILSVKVAPRGTGLGIAPLIKKGMRAFTIHTPTIASGVAGFILPGNKVDVLLTVTRGASNDTTGGGSTSTLLQNIEILAVDQRLDAPSTNKVDPKELRSVTLLVVPDQAAKLGLAQSKGTLHLSLRNDSDKDAADTRVVTLKELRFLEEEPTNLSGDTPSLAKPRKAKTFHIRTYRGGAGGTVYVKPEE